MKPRQGGELVKTKRRLSLEPERTRKKLTKEKRKMKSKRKIVN